MSISRDITEIENKRHKDDKSIVDYYKREQALEIAERMKESGISEAEIAKFTQLSFDDIEKL